MAVTSFQFLALFAVSLVIYYLVPQKYQWFTLLIYSVVFFVLSSSLLMGVYLLINIAVTYMCIVVIGKARAGGKEMLSKASLFFGIFVNVGMLAVLRYSIFLVSNINWGMQILHIKLQFHAPNFDAPIGISFYTLISVGYLLDYFWGGVQQSNILKTALFIGYYPQMTSGPITRYKEMDGQLYIPHKFAYQKVAFGMQRILWGLYKKLVISTRTESIVDSIYANTDHYHGLYIWMAAFLFMLQLYTDFSGCMDIIMGVSECYGIDLPENFRTPFFSRSVQEYWQRWHITLGSWLRDYILYPILRTKIWRDLTQWIKKNFGKKAAKQIPSYLGMLCVWLLVGLWHGGRWKYVIGMGMWFWGCIVLAQIFSPVFQKLYIILQIDTESFSWRLFQSLRVFILVSIGNMFFRLSSFKETLHVIKLGFCEWNPWIFFDGSVTQLGVTYSDLNIIIFGIFILFIVGILHEKFDDARIWIQKQIFLFRWFIWLSLFVIILIYGVYGPGYNASDFIYRGF